MTLKKNFATQVKQPETKTKKETTMNRNFTIILCTNAETLGIHGVKSIEFIESFSGILKEFESALFDATFKKGFKIDYKINDNHRDYNGGFHYRNTGLLDDGFFFVSGTEEVEDEDGEWEEADIEELTEEEEIVFNSISKTWFELISPYRD